MKAEDFKASPSGYLTPTIQGAMAFVPHPLPPRSLDLGRLTAPLAKATHALGELSGMGRSLPNPHLLIRPFTRVEAIASSKIEGTVTTMQELLFLEAEAANTSKTRTDTREVNNYTRALEHGLRRIEELPLSKRLICELHKILLQDVAIDRGAHLTPGEFKIEQNWIGGRTIQNARFVPPPPAEAINALSDLEKYIHDQSDDLPLLIQLALIHYQFETIHPFPDGNGRVGRLIIPLVLCEQNAMSQPLLYLSAFFEKHYDNYIDHMFEVSKSGAWEEWIIFFLDGVETTAKNAIKKSHALQDLHREYFSKIQEARSSALLGKLIDSLFYIPAITIPVAMRETGIAYNSAKNNIQRLVDLGIISPKSSAATGRERPQWFFADQIMKIASQDA
jgi:Fic family protein